MCLPDMQRHPFIVALIINVNFIKNFTTGYPEKSKNNSKFYSGRVAEKANVFGCVDWGG